MDSVERAPTIGVTATRQGGYLMPEQPVFDVSPNAPDLLLLFRRATTEVRLPN